MRVQESDTLLECTCKWLERAAAEPSKPIEFDARTNEYYLVRQTATGRGYSVLRYCPWCGCRGPKSRAGELFATLTDTERSRLAKLTAELRTFEAVVAALGEPDHDYADGYVETAPATETSPEVTTVHRTLVYDRLSETARVRFTDLHDGTVGVSFRGKYVGGGGVEKG